MPPEAVDCDYTMRRLSGRLSLMPVTLVAFYGAGSDL